MKLPVDRKYSETHEWFLVDGNVAMMGITQYAADELTDITYIELPEVGTQVTVGDRIAEVESVKATSEIFCAVAGTVTEVNSELVDHPELINDDAFEEGWIAKVEMVTVEPIQALMTAKEYQAFVKNAH